MSAQNAPLAVVDNAAAPIENEMYYRFAANDGQEFRVSVAAIKHSETLEGLVFAMKYSLEDVENNDAIPVGNIDGETLKLVFEWCEHYKGETFPVENDSVPFCVEIPDFDAKFLEMDDKKLLRLITAVDYLNVKQLLNVSCQKLANLGKGKTPVELRKIYQFSSEEEDEAAEKAAREFYEKCAKEAAEKAAAEREEWEAAQKDRQVTSASAYF